MTIYNIKTLKNNNDTWNKPSSIITLKFHHSIPKHRRKLSYAILTMLYEMGKYPIYANFYKHKGDIQTISGYYIFYYDNNILDDYTIYKINDNDERKKVERIIKIKNVL